MGWYFHIPDKTAEDRLTANISAMIAGRGYVISGITFDEPYGNISRITITFQKKTNASSSHSEELENIGSIRFTINQAPEPTDERGPDELEPTDFIDAKLFLADGTNASFTINNENKEDEDLVQCYNGSMMALPKPEYFKYKNNSGGARKKTSKKSKKSRKTKKSRRTIRRR